MLAEEGFRRAWRAISNWRRIALTMKYLASGYVYSRVEEIRRMRVFKIDRTRFSEQR
jgi:hypothetical protein